MKFDLPDSPNKRCDHDTTLLDIFEKFDFHVPLSAADGTCGNLCSDLYPYNLSSFYDLVSAPMLLARLVAAGLPITVFGQDGYKCTWETLMRHRETGLIVTFYDYKGAASFGSSWPLDKVKHKSFIDDVKTLTKNLTSARFPHPYDGCIVGEIA